MQLGIYPGFLLSFSFLHSLFARGAGIRRDDFTQIASSAIHSHYQPYLTHTHRKKEKERQRILTIFYIHIMNHNWTFFNYALTNLLNYDKLVSIFCVYLCVDLYAFHFIIESVTSPWPLMSVYKSECRSVCHNFITVTLTHIGALVLSWD